MSLLLLLSAEATAVVITLRRELSVDDVPRTLTVDDILRGLTVDE